MRNAQEQYERGHNGNDPWKRRRPATLVLLYVIVTSRTLTSAVTWGIISMRVW
jgi:hypothetical protein